jgi:hypothetical protein
MANGIGHWTSSLCLPARGSGSRQAVPLVGRKRVRGRRKPHRTAPHRAYHCPQGRLPKTPVGSTGLVAVFGASRPFVAVVIYHSHDVIAKRSWKEGCTWCCIHPLRNTTTRPAIGAMVRTPPPFLSLSQSCSCPPWLASHVGLQYKIQVIFRPVCKSKRQPTADWS